VPSAPIVDYQAHWYPRSYVESLVGRDAYPRARWDDGDLLYEHRLGDLWRLGPDFVDLDVHLGDMDANGVDVAVISANLLGEVGRLDVEEAVQITERLNEEVAAAQQRHPDRIIGLCMLPTQDAEAAIQVLDRAIEGLRLKGVCLLSNIGGRPIVEPDLMRLYRRIEALRVPVFLHPSHTSVAVDSVLGPTVEVGLAWMFDTAAAALALIYGGVLDACPDLTIVHPHLGGVLPYVTGRVIEDEIGVDVEHDLMTYLRTRFFVDCVQKTPGALPLAIATYGPERILYGTDFPWVPRPSTRAYVEDNLSPPLVEQVLHRNVLPGLELPG
jgi:predicted TIM-barrel fold metal-dependent hydrolase